MTILFAIDSGGSFLKKSTDSTIESLVIITFLFKGIFKKEASFVKLNVSFLLKFNFCKYFLIIYFSVIFLLLIIN